MVSNLHMVSFAEQPNFRTTLYTVLLHANLPKLLTIKSVLILKERTVSLNLPVLVHLQEL